MGSIARAGARYARKSGCLTIHSGMTCHHSPRKRIQMPDPQTTEEEPIWYLALKKMLMAQGPGVIPSSIRINRGQRFALDGDEPIDVDELIRLKVVKIYEESDAEWAQGELAKVPKPRRRRNRG